MPMRSHMLLPVVLLSFSVLAHVAEPRSEGPSGGPPAIRVANKASGKITLLEWNQAQGVTLAGCVPDAQVVSMTLCVRNCTGKEEALTVNGARFSPVMKRMVENLPTGTAFTVSVEVRDQAKKMWEVPKASFIISR